MSTQTHPSISHAANIEQNKAYFDNIADKYDTIHGAREIVGIIAKAMRGAVELEKESTSVLDFGCGIGLLSRELAPYVKSIVGVDISEASVEVYNRLAAESDDADKMKAVVLDLQGAPGELEDKKFDVVTSSMVYHHLDTPSLYTQILASHLAPSGKLLIASLMRRTNFNTSSMSESMLAAIPNMAGFTEESIKEMFEGAGLKDVKYAKIWGGVAPAPQHVKVMVPDEERVIEVFLAVGTKPEGDV
ncbi:unnamed protein product [Peniophora sp. CBMAI 1063]|nr:unnamed protein product [Peniophora sp. CBMAI 1063]